MSGFSVEKSGQVIRVSCPAAFDMVAARDFLALTRQWLNEEFTLVLLDFTATVSLDPALFRPLVLFNQMIKKRPAYLATIGLNAELARQIHASGLDSVFSPRASMSEALAMAGLEPKKTAGRSIIDVEFVTPFITAALSTLEIQVGMIPVAGKARLKKTGEVPPIDIAGIISLTSNVFTGSIALCFPAATFLGIYGKMTGEMHKTIVPEIEDAAGEILNIIFGQAKSDLNDRKGYEIQRAIPTVVRGDQLTVHHLGRNIALILPFESEQGSFHIEISADRI